MRSLGGLVLLAGVGVGLFVYLPAPGDTSLSLYAVQSASDTEQPAPRPTRQSAQRTIAQSLPHTERTFAPSVSLASLSAPGAFSGDSAIKPAASGVWQGVVSTSGSATPTSSSSLTPQNPQSRYELIVEIQKQLKRVGCYYGRVDGSWGAGSKEAMHTFAERVNAALPVEEPDYLLLNLLHAQSGKTCGACPPGLALSAAGQCVAPPSYAQTPSAARGRGEVLPWKAAAANPETPAAAPKPLFRPVSTSVVSSEPLPGRMAIGGPRELPSVDALDSGSAYTQQGGAPVATATLEGAGSRAAPTHASPQSAAISERRVRARSTPRHDPIRQNLLLSLGGAY